MVFSDIDREDFINNKFSKMCVSHKYTPSILPSVKRIVVFGDIHGDYRLAVQMLIIAKVVDYNEDIDEFVWVGGDTHVVQVGDQVDRCRPTTGACNQPNVTMNDEASDIKILKLFTHLDKLAIKHGGRVISLLGNHEIANSMGELGYVSYLGLKEFENYKDPKNPNLKFTSGWQARAHAFAPGNEYGTLLGCTRVPAIIIGSNLFVHAGIIDALIKEFKINKNTELENINIAIRKWLLGLVNRKYVDKIVSSRAKNSMFWVRVLGEIAPYTPYTPKAKDSRQSNVCNDNIEKVLEVFNVGSIIIGHTPQTFTFSKGINGTCTSKETDRSAVWRVDNASSAAFNPFDRNFNNSTGNRTTSRQAQVLEILNDSEFNILK
jgi:hypothetical protein